jgi:ectoine hydroxylase-related dioxygenase (phytanoyl-CoA dioxygenase family)
MRDLLANPEVQNLLADQSLATVAQDYLESRPSIDVLAMWWHTAFSDVPDSEAAQYFHFDMDRPKWLKCFIYLTDVTPESGPHVFVAGSHRTGGIPPEFLRRGYVRLMDDEVLAEYGARNIIEFSAPRGTIILEDTRGLHKGANVRRGDRLMLQIQFSNSLFGGSYPEARFKRELSEPLREAVARYPKLYSAYS